MAKTADIGGKRLISLVPNEWVQWVTQDSQVTFKELLDSEFQWVSRQSDIIIKVSDAEGKEFLVLTELQLRYSDQLPQRMRNYVALAEEKFKLPTYPVLVNILPPSELTTVVDCYECEFMGIRAYQNYRVINLWEIDAETVFQQSLRPLLPFMPVLRGGETETNIRLAAQILRADETLQGLEQLLGFFARFVLDERTIQDILRWDMLVLEESPWYQEILRKGAQRGIQQGIQQERQINLLKLLQLRFGAADPEIEATLSTLNLEQLSELTETALTVNSLDEFQQHLPKPLGK